jgi:DNA methylase
LLWQGRRTALPRHETLNAMLDWSYSLRVIAADHSRWSRRQFFDSFRCADLSHPSIISCLVPRLDASRAASARSHQPLHSPNSDNPWQYDSAGTQARKGNNVLELHPTVKPVQLVMDALLDCSNRGDIVLDCFLGSGTTLLAAERTGRICRGIELDPLYVDTAIRRWQNLTGQSAVRVSDGKLFHDIEAEKESGDE